MTAETVYTNSGSIQMALPRATPAPTAENRSRFCANRAPTGPIPLPLAPLADRSAKKMAASRRPSNHPLFLKHSRDWVDECSDDEARGLL